LKSNGNKFFFLAFLLLSGLIIHHFLMPIDIWANEGPTPGRKTYNLIMLIVNFSILAFIIFKFGREPLMNFLTGIRSDVEKDLSSLKGQLSNCKMENDAEIAKINDFENQVKSIYDRIMNMGIREKEKIIEQGKITAEKMIRDAKEYSRYKILLAKKAFSDEIVDLAIDTVEENLKKGISKKDNEQLINKFMDDLEKANKVA